MMLTTTMLPTKLTTCACEIAKEEIANGNNGNGDYEGDYAKDKHVDDKN